MMCPKTSLKLLPRRYGKWQLRKKKSTSCQNLSELLQLADHDVYVQHHQTSCRSQSCARFFNVKSLWTTSSPTVLDFSETNFITLLYARQIDGCRWRHYVQNCDTNSVSVRSQEQSVYKESFNQTYPKRVIDGFSNRSSRHCWPDIEC